MAGNATSHACLVDADCTGQLVCYRQVPWLQDGHSECLCYTYYGQRGEGCRERTVRGAVMVAFTGLLCALALATAARALADVFVVHRKLGGICGCVANVATTSTMVALLSHFGWQLSFLLEMVQPMEGTHLVVRQDGSKVMALEVTTRGFLILTQSMAILTLLIICVTWLEVSRTTMMLHSKARMRLSRYRKGCIAFGFVYTGVMGIATSLGRPELNLLIGMPFGFVLVAMIYSGRRGVIGMLSSMHASHNERKELMPARTRVLINSIDACSLRVVKCQAGYCVAGAVNFLAIGLTPGGARGGCPKDGAGICYVAWIGRSLPAITLWLLIVLFNYCHSGVRARARRKAATSSAGEVTNKTFTALASH